MEGGAEREWGTLAQGERGHLPRGKGSSDKTRDSLVNLNFRETVIVQTKRIPNVARGYVPALEVFIVPLEFQSHGPSGMFICGTWQPCVG